MFNGGNGTGGQHALIGVRIDTHIGPNLGQHDAVEAERIKAQHLVFL
jgi:hypothetical protein